MFKTDTQTVAIETATFVEKYGDEKSFSSFCKRDKNAPAHYNSGIIVGTKIVLDEELRKQSFSGEEILEVVGGVVCDYREPIDSMLTAMSEIIPDSKLLYAGCSCYGVICEGEHPVSMDEVGFNLGEIAKDYFGFTSCAGETELPDSLFLVAGLFFPKS